MQHRTNVRFLQTREDWTNLRFSTAILQRNVRPEQSGTEIPNVSLGKFEKGNCRLLVLIKRASCSKGLSLKQRQWTVISVWHWHSAVHVKPRFVGTALEFSRSAVGVNTCRPVGASWRLATHLVHLTSRQRTFLYAASKEDDLRTLRTAS